MKFSVKPQTALNFTKFSVYLVSSWPPPKFTNKYQKFWFHFRWWFAFIFLICLLLPLLNGIHTNRNDPLKIINTVCLSAATIQAILKMLISRSQWPRLRILHSKMKEFVENADELEEKYIMKYIDKGLIFHGIITLSMYLVSLIFVIESALQSQPFPTDGTYPFPIKYETIRLLLYIQQTIALFLIASALAIDFQVAILLWFIGMKFEILGEYCVRVSTDNELNYCINKHQQILRYSNQVKYSVRYIALSTVATTTIGVICGCLALISKLPISVKFRVANIVGNAAIELFAYAWPGDNLIWVSQAIGWKIYQCNWINGSTKMVRNVMTMIQRSQWPVTISINGFIPDLSFQYYTSFLSMTFSYFTTLRIILSASSGQ